MRRKLTLDRQTIRLLTVRDLTLTRGGASGEPCDTTVGHTKCDLAGCSGGATCFESAQTQGNCAA